MLYMKCLCKLFARKRNCFIFFLICFLRCHFDSDYFCHSFSCAPSMGLCLSTVMIFICCFDSFKCDQWVCSATWICTFDIIVPVNVFTLLTILRQHSGASSLAKRCSSLPFYCLHYLAHVRTALLSMSRQTTISETAFIFYLIKHFIYSTVVMI